MFDIQEKNLHETQIPTGEYGRDLQAERHSLWISCVSSQTQVVFPFFRGLLPIEECWSCRKRNVV